MADPAHGRKWDCSSAAKSGPCSNGPMPLDSLRTFYHDRSTSGHSIRPFWIQLEGKTPYR